MSGREIHTTFAGGGLDRCGELRRDTPALAQALADPATRFVPVWREQCLVADGAAVLLAREQLGALPDSIDTRLVFLGRDAAGYLFAVDLPDVAGDGPQAGFRELREVMGELPAADASLVAYARAMLGWQARHAHCGVCGAPMRRPKAAL